MCNPNCLRFVTESLSSQDVRGKKVVEVGALDVNGSPRSVVTALAPAEYVGVDVVQGRGVDVVCPVGSLVSRFGEASFDVLITTEMLEHVRDWRGAVSNVKRVLRPGGVLVLTTRSIGFPYHGYPFDFWRFEPEDLRALFGDLEIEVVRDEAPGAFGVFMKARRPSSFAERDPSAHRLHSILTGRREGPMSQRRVDLLHARRRVRHLAASLVPRRLRATLKRLAGRG